jgi:hypothetical protein
MNSFLKFYLFTLSEEWSVYPLLRVRLGALSCCINVKSDYTYIPLNWADWNKKVYYFFLSLSLPSSSHTSSIFLPLSTPKITLKSEFCTGWVYLQQITSFDLYSTSSSPPIALPSSFWWVQCYWCMWAAMGRFVYDDIESHFRVAVGE